MTIEVATDVTQLNPAYPEGASAFGKGDDHIRLVKYCLYTQFYGSTTVSVGVNNFHVATQVAGTNSTLAASTAFTSAAIAAAAFSTALPSQAGNAGKFVYTDGATASWVAVPQAGQNIYLKVNFGGL